MLGGGSGRAPYPARFTSRRQALGEGSRRVQGGGSPRGMLRARSAPSFHVIMNLLDFVLGSVS